MIEQTMELRGIRISHLMTYLIECGGQTVGQVEEDPDRNALPLLIGTDQWQAEIMREETVTITSRFHVNAVFIRFTSEDEAVLSRLLERFRLKVIRVGG
jgi:hypothetical protein